MSLFDTTPPGREDDAQRPLAERMRPERWEDFVGSSTFWVPANRCACRSSATNCSR